MLNAMFAQFQDTKTLQVVGLSCVCGTGYYKVWKEQISLFVLPDKQTIHQRRNGKVRFKNCKQHFNVASLTCNYEVAKFIGP